MEREQLKATVTAAQNGDSEALNLLFNTYYNDVYYFALKTLKDADLACDITQETFVEIINTLQDLKEPAAFVTWMRQVTYHQCTRYFKKKKEVLVEEDEDGNSVFDTLEEEREEFIPGEGVDKEDFRATILALLDTLSEEQRAAVLMHYYHEMSVKDIAEAQQVSEGTVKSRLNYARKSLKKSVEDYEKKHDVKLHCAGVLPLLLWLFASAGKEVMPVAAAKTVAGGIASVTGTTISLSTGGGVAVTTATTAAGTGLMAKIAALPVTVKIISGITAGALLIGSVVVVNNGFGKDPEPTEAVVMQTDPTTGNQEGNDPSSETTAPSGPMETNPDSTQPSEDPVVPPTQPSTPPEDSPVVPTEPDRTEPDQTEPDDDTLTENKGNIIGNIIPVGCTYTMKDGTVLTEGQAMPEKMQDGEYLTTADYTYRCDFFTGWSVRVKDKTQTQYEALYSEINGVSITNLGETFHGCTAMTVAPEIPATAKNLFNTFRDCDALVTAPVIPDGVEELSFTFFDCDSLMEVPKLPDSLKVLDNTFGYCKSLVCTPSFPEGIVEMVEAFEHCTALTTVMPLPSAVTTLEGTFMGCTALVQAPALPEGVVDISSLFNRCNALMVAPEIPSTVRDMTQTFYMCSQLVQTPALPEGITALKQTFSGCTSMTDAPRIPNSVISMSGTFGNCSALTQAPELPGALEDMQGAFQGSGIIKAPAIPASVKNMSSAFMNCKSLNEAPVLPDGVTDLSSAFSGCKALVAAPEIPATVEKLFYTFYGCTSLTGEIIIHATPTDVRYCFQSTSQPIVLIGDGANLQELADTSSIGNVTVKQ